MRLEAIESLSLAIAQLMDRERDLQIELDRVRAQKNDKLARIVSIANGTTEHPESTPTAFGLTKKERLRAYVIAAEPGAIFTTGQIAAGSDVEPNVASMYLGHLVSEGALERYARGRFRIPEKGKENAPPEGEA